MSGQLNRCWWVSRVAAACIVTHALAGAAAAQPTVTIEAEQYAKQQGSIGRDRKAAASGGEVLGQEFGAAAGHFAEYELSLDAPMPTAFLAVRYARQPSGGSALQVAVDDEIVGQIAYESTGGWGDAAKQFKFGYLKLRPLAAGRHRVRLTVSRRAGEGGVTTRPAANDDPLSVVGNRSDKNSVGAGNNVALYTGAPSRFFFATHELGNIFNAVDGGTVVWFPDHVRVSPDVKPNGSLNVNLDQVLVLPQLPAGASVSEPSTTRGIQQERDVCVTRDDVIVSRIQLRNTSAAAITETIRIDGDCRESFDWRAGSGGEKFTRAAEDGSGVVMIDRNVFPGVLKDGLVMVVAAAGQKPDTIDADTPGAYHLEYAVSVPANGEATLTVACAVGRDEKSARDRLAAVLAHPDPIADNRASWESFYRQEAPSFRCSDQSLTELYDFRWFLLRFSTAGGDLGLFKYPVIMEGRQAFQTYCCYSAPFMAFDRNWTVDPSVGWGHIANMANVAYADGRFPWYASPRTNDVPLDHRSKTGMSLLPWTLWRWYEIHGDKGRLGELYDAMARNTRWWIADRDKDGNGLFAIDHQLETGMDDLHRRWKRGKPEQYEAVDATVYAYLNLRAVANMARELGKADDATSFNAYADRSAKALETICWDAQEQRYKDRDPNTGELADYDSICTFYPLMTDVVGKANLGMIGGRLLNEKAFWTKHPIPALSQQDPEFDPVKGYWRGPSWPAANTHVVEGFASTAKRLDRSLLPQAAELFRRAAANHLQPRADFYERYDPFDGRGLSNFRDYMHSWWIDLYIRHVAGLMIEDDGSLVIDPLPLGLSHFSLQNVPLRGHRVDVLFNEGTEKGLVVRIDGKVVARDETFVCGGEPLRIERP